MFAKTATKQKTQTSRERGLKKINENPGLWHYDGIRYVLEKKGWDIVAHFLNPVTGEKKYIKCPYAADFFWIREKWRPSANGTEYQADNILFNKGYDDKGWRPPMFMRRTKCRMIIKKTDIRIRKLGEFNALDAVKEGIPYSSEVNMVGEFKALWDSINGKNHWNKSKYVWVIQYELHSFNP